MLGIIAIPGMMTGAILGGSSVTQAARLQTIIIFMISSSTALASIIITFLTLNTVVDAEHRVRPDRVDHRAHVVWRARSWVFVRLLGIGRVIWQKVYSSVQRQRKSLADHSDKEAEMEELLPVSS